MLKLVWKVECVTLIVILLTGERKTAFADSEENKILH